MPVAEPGAFWRYLSAIVRPFSFGLSPALASRIGLKLTPVAPEPCADCIFATVTIVHLLAQPRPTANETPMASVRQTAIEPETSVAAIAVQTRPTAFTRRPLAAQLAVTAARNVAKGRTPARSQKKPVRSTGALPKRASLKKPKPVIIAVTAKRAPKRRHVWLSTRVRVITAPASNVVTMTAARPMAAKGSNRALRLAA